MVWQVFKKLILFDTIHSHCIKTIITTTITTNAMQQEIAIQPRELEPFDWNSYAVIHPEVSPIEWDDDYLNDIPFELLTLQDLETDSVSSSTVQDIMMYTIDRKSDHIYENETTEELLDCPICYEPIKHGDKVTSNCNHHYCSSCMLTYLDHCHQSRTEPCCAMCRNVYTIFEIPDNNTFEKLKAHVEEYDDSEEDYPTEFPQDSFDHTIQRRVWSFSQRSTVDFDDIEHILDN